MKQKFGYFIKSLIFAAILLIAVDGEAQTVRRVVMDFDGDGKSDISVFRPSGGIWYMNNSTTGMSATAFGFAADKLVPADYDGDGKTDVAVYRDGIWYLNRSGLGFTGIQFGTASDIPVPADYDGDGKAELCVFRPSTGTWYQFNLVNNQARGFAFGQQDDKPIPADYDGDGKADIAVFRGIKWFILGSTVGLTGNQNFGNSATTLPVPADYTGDGKADLAIKGRVQNSDWLILRSENNQAYLVEAGIHTDTPVPADYDGDGKTDVADYRPSTGVWILQRTQMGLTTVTYGAATDIPLPSVYIR